MRIAERFTVEERAERFQRRYTGPWRTVEHEVAGVVVTTRYRRQPRIEVVRLSVAGHDLWIHAVWRGALVPVLLPIVKALSRRLP